LEIQKYEGNGKHRDDFAGLIEEYPPDPVPKYPAYVEMTELDAQDAAMDGVWYPICPFCDEPTFAGPDTEVVVCVHCEKRFGVVPWR